MDRLTFAMSPEEVCGLNDETDPMMRFLAPLLVFSALSWASAASAHPAGSHCHFNACGQPVATATVSCCGNGPDAGLPAYTPREAPADLGAPAPAARSAHRPIRKAKAHAPRRTSAARPAARRHAAARPAGRHAVRPARPTHTAAPYGDPIRDHAAIYGASGHGNAVPLAAYAGRGDRWVSGSVTTTSVTTQWIAPAQTVIQGGQTCGWGGRVAHAHGHAPRHERAWLCACAEGWRPPGY